MRLKDHLSGNSIFYLQNIRQLYFQKVCYQKVCYQKFCIISFLLLALFIGNFILIRASVQAAPLAPNLLVTISANPTSVNPGDIAVYTIRYRCASLVEHCLNAQIVDTVPAGMNIINYSRTGGLVSAATLAGNTITWNLQSPNSPTGQLDAGSTGTLKIFANFAQCGGSSAAANYTNQVNFSATGATTASATRDVTLNSANTAACPTPPPSTTGFRKISHRTTAEIGGTSAWNLSFPSHTSAYTVTEDFVNEGIVLDLERAFNLASTVQLHVQCGSEEGTSTWHDFGTNRNTREWHINLSGVLPGACVAVDTGNGYMGFNITRARWIMPASTSSSSELAIHYPTSNLFTTAQLPNWTAASVGSYITNCISSSEVSMGDSGQSCARHEVVGVTGPYTSMLKRVASAPDIDSDEDPFHVPGLESLSRNTDTIPPIDRGPSDVVYITQISVNPQSGKGWENPIIYDLFPAGLDYIPYDEGGSNFWHISVPAWHDWPNIGWPSGIDPTNNPACMNPIFNRTQNWNGTGRTLLSWDFTGCTLYGTGIRSTRLSLHFSGRIVAGTLASTLLANQLHYGSVTGWTPSECSGNVVADSQDFDGDGDTLELLCEGETADYTVPTLINLQSAKWVKGALDGDQDFANLDQSSGYTRYPLSGDTKTDGAGRYQLFIENTGNVNVTQLDVVDFLPHSGDTDTLGVLGARASDWAMQLSGDITIERSNDGGVTWAAVPAADLLHGTALYTNSTNPCRFSVAVPDGDDIDVTGLFPAGCTALITGTAASNLSFGFRFQPTADFAPGERLRVTVPIELNGNPPGCDDPACAGDVINNGAISWNSFAFGGIYTNSGAQPLLDTEPIKVGLRMIDSSNFTSLGNYVWDDADGDGVQDATEQPLVGVTVNLYNAAGNTLLQTAQTGTDGFYRFDGLTPSTTYVIKLDNASDYTSGPLVGYSLTQADVGSDALDSDGVYASNGYPVITTTVGIVTGVENMADPTEYPTHDFGFWQPASLGDYIWYDTDGFGDQNETLPVENVSVTLWGTGADGAVGGGDDLQIQTGADGILGNVDDSTTAFTTGADGRYKFSNLPPGSYYVSFNSATITGTDPISGTVVNPSDWVWTLALATGNDANDSDVSTTGNSRAVYLARGEHNPNIDAGLKPIPRPTTAVSVGNYVWEDTNGNNLQDGGELGIPNVRVDLLDGSSFPIATTFTDGTGFYQFDNLEDGGSYELLFTPPISYTLVAQNGGGDTVDSDANATTGSTGTFTVSPSAAQAAGDPQATATLDSRWDAGLVGTLSLGNLVWQDNNNNGQFDAGEQPISGTTVNLLSACGGGVIQTITTDANGKYLFVGLSAANYVVEVAIPSGMLSSTDIASSANPDNGTDSDDNGVDSSTHPGFVCSNAITLEFGGGSWGESDHGQAINGITDATLNRNADYTLDFGFVPTSLFSVAINKSLNGAEPVLETAPISFTIRITNTGSLTLTTLPLTDTYDLIYLSYDSVTGSTPPSQDNNNDGQIHWPDLTAQLGDLGPGASFSVIVNFSARADTTGLAAQSFCINPGETCNLATTSIVPGSVLTDTDDVRIEAEQKSNLGDWVWYDLNANGLKDDGATGINGVRINLYLEGLNGNPVDGIIQASEFVTYTTTMNDTGDPGADSAIGEAGFYNFSINDNHSFIVEVDSSNFNPGGPLADFIYTGNNAATIYNGTQPRPINIGAGPVDEDNVDFPFWKQSPEIALSKVLNGNSPVRTNTPISFTIRITNTGSMAITSLPLTDTYNTAYLSFITASIAPSDTVNDGQLNWPDLTASLGQSLAPSGTISIVVQFLAWADSTALPNGETINLATVFTQTAQAPVHVVNPTAVNLTNYHIIGADEGVEVSWQTVNESQIAGFYLHRQEPDGTLIPLTAKPIAAQQAGQPMGADYIYMDSTIVAGKGYAYLLEMISTNGTSSYLMLGEMEGAMLVFLPLIAP